MLKLLVHAVSAPYTPDSLNFSVLRGHKDAVLDPIGQSSSLRRRVLRDGCSVFFSQPFGNWRIVGNRVLKDSLSKEIFDERVCAESQQTFDNVYIARLDCNMKCCAAHPESINVKLSFCDEELDGCFPTFSNLGLYSISDEQSPSEVGVWKGPGF
ncbi:uncharacterized protein B0I36DRAFT_350731 [Microdochium trichocladiopsis]|uniref:Uncharacterized protein n=1 Tax=Microdochium trichocladiopsis TaxID=1682393 RepID=A0A9P9BMY5_9PEZI|nr:uncharacterized protein B0I36DRAFT_350731 [Microdochium trichocladiopsis]KAH7027161.1 hypothetical protein B0I36DRAFT_350731 [Microdochium trichocladiopsis]